MFRSARTSSISSAAAILNPTPFIKSRKLETYAKKDKWLNAQNAKIETAKKDRAEKASDKARTKTSKKDEVEVKSERQSKPKAVRSIKMSPAKQEKPSKKKIKILKAPVETKVDSKANSTGVYSEDSTR